jgi:hypothetical protein
MDFDNEGARRLLLKFASVCDEHVKKGYISEEGRRKLIDALLNNKNIPIGFEDNYMPAIQGVSTIARGRGGNKIIMSDVPKWFTSKPHNNIAEMHKLEDCKGYRGKVLSVENEKITVQTDDGDKFCEPLYVHPKVGDTVAIHHNKVIYRFEDE